MNIIAQWFTNVNKRSMKIKLKHKGGHSQALHVKQWSSAALLDSIFIHRLQKTESKFSTVI